MMTRMQCLCASLVAVGVGSTALADFVIGNEVNVVGVSGPQFGFYEWGDTITGGAYTLGSLGVPYQAAQNPLFVVSVSSWVNSATSVTFSFDFSGFSPELFSLHALEIRGLKADGSLTSVTASQGFAFLINDNSGIRWDGSGAGLGADPKLLLTIEQIPGPGGVAVLAWSVLGLTRGRRRR